MALMRKRTDKKSVPVPKQNYGIEPITTDLIDLENILTQYHKTESARINH